ncbi:hypothetical protein DYL61_20035 [Pseudomonas nabeulensis]|uniref:Uncharacterized protein n=1 Tax=Pseudomonas nabeulensis TaxID=2293833 RepID=A0A4Z0AW94_9PSED|nr:hypothetical protein DYL61_20035 [Pseudomonas nabeulensis]
MRECQPKSLQLTHRHRGQAPSHSVDRVRHTQPVGSKAAALLLLICGRLVKHAGRTQALERGHAEPRRGTEWWGEDLLLPFGSFQKWAAVRAEP